MSQLSRRTVLATVATAAVLGLAGCSPTGTTSSGSSTGPSASAGARAGGRAAAVPSGRELNSLLLPGSALPAGFRIDAGGTRNTGDHDVAGASSPIPAAKACDALSSTSWINTAAVNGVSFAQNDYTHGTYDTFAQEIDGFPGGGAHAAMAGLRKVFAGCAHFTSQQGGTSYATRLTVKSLPGLGDEALEGVVTSPAWSGGTTLVAVRVGDLVVTTLDNAQSDTGGAGVGLTRSLVGRVSAR